MDVRARSVHLQILGQPSNAKEFMAPILAGVSAGLSALAEAVERGRIEIGADRLLHVPPLSALSDDTEPRKTREAVFQRIGDVQLPDILLEVDAATHFSEELLARRASSADELFALYGALLAHGTDNDAKGVSTMIPGIDVAPIAVAMRALEQPGRLRRANECVAQFQSRIPIAALWGNGDKGSADMMALDASRHLWTSRVDPRRRTFAAGIYTHVRDHWGIFHDQPIVLNEGFTPPGPARARRQIPQPGCEPLKAVAPRRTPDRSADRSWAGRPERDRRRRAPRRCRGNGRRAAGSPTTAIAAIVAGASALHSIFPLGRRCIVIGRPSTEHAQSRAGTR
jgi:hypothetical protein